MVFFEKIFFTRFPLKLFLFIFTISPILSSCSSTVKSNILKPSSKELYSLKHPSKEVNAKIDALMPSVMKWYKNVDKALYQKGRHLTKIEKEQAKQLGVKNPNAVRVIYIKKFPEPSNEKESASHEEGARAMGNIIMIKPRFKNNSIVLCHELVHIAQKDRMGLGGFLKQLVLEKHVLGYSKSLLENEAYSLQREIL